jgi:hypothetical protein
MYTKVAGENRQFLLVPNLTQLPKTLAPGEYFNEASQDLSVLDQPLEYLAAWDSLGRVYKAGRRDMKSIRQEVNKKGRNP